MVYTAQMFWPLLSYRVQKTAWCYIRRLKSIVMIQRHWKKRKSSSSALCSKRIALAGKTRDGTTRFPYSSGIGGFFGPRYRSTGVPEHCRFLAFICFPVRRFTVIPIALVFRFSPACLACNGTMNNTTSPTSACRVIEFGRHCSHQPHVTPLGFDTFL